MIVLPPVGGDESVQQTAANDGCLVGDYKTNGFGNLFRKDNLANLMGGRFASPQGAMHVSRENTASVIWAKFGITELSTLFLCVRMEFLHRCYEAPGKVLIVSAPPLD